MPMTLTDLLSQPIFWKLFIGYFAFSAIIGGLPSPEKVQQYGVKPGIGMLVYATIFGILHLFAGSVTRAALAFKIPGATADDSKSIDDSANGASAGGK